MHRADGHKRFPALRSRIGDWYYYVTTLPFREVAQRLQPATDLVTTRDMSTWIQRNIVEVRARRIADYLINQRQHFFPGIVVGVFQGEPTWYEIDVEENVALTDPALDRNAQYNLGLLELDGSEKLYAIDGQHRVAGIRAALIRLDLQEDAEHYDRLASEDLTVLFVSADIEREGQLERVRTLFAALNKEAKKVSDAEIVALDEDDAAAIVTRWIATQYDGLRVHTSSVYDESPHLVQLGTRDEIPPSNHRSITTIVSLYRMTKGVFQKEITALNRTFQGNRPDDGELKAIYNEAVMVWDLMGEHDEALGSVLGSDPAEQRAAIHRDENGGHILFRPMGLQSFGRALGLLRTRGIDTRLAVRNLCQLPMSLSESPWVHAVWNPNTRRMHNDSQPVVEALFLHMVGHQPRSTRMNLSRRYRELLGLPEGSNPLEDVQVKELQ